MNNLIKISVLLSFAAVASGNLPDILKQVHKAQLQLLHESKSSNWGTPMLLKTKQ